MIYCNLVCQNQLFLTSMVNYFSIKKNINCEPNEYFDFLKLKFDIKDNELTIYSDFQEKISFKLPKDITFISSKIINILENYNIDISGAKYFPLKNLIYYKNSNLILGDIQNTLLSNLVFAKSVLPKKVIYKKIWPNEKEFFVNKIDTHLTNLKNNLNMNMGLDLIITSKNSNLKIQLN